MKFSKLMLATLAVCGASQAMAAGTTRLTGASASLINVVKGAQALCATAKGLTSTTLTAADFKVYITGSNGSSLGNWVTAKCSADFAGTTVDVLAVNVNGGSESAVTSAADGFSSAAGAAPIPAAFVLPVSTTLTAAVASASAAAGQGFGALSFLPAGTLFNNGAVTTAASANTEFALSEGGHMDVEGKFFPTASALEAAGLVDPSAYVSAGFSQAFGVAVSKDLYEALQAAQAASLPGCAIGATNVACQPSLTRGQISAAIGSDTSSTGPKSKGANLFGLTTNVKLTYAKRPPTSGTQQSAQLYFLDYDGSGKQTVVASGATVTTKYLASELASSGNIRSFLTAGTATDYRFGILSAENNPIGGSDTYRFVKLNGVAVTEGVAGASNTATAIKGDYDFVFDSVAFCNVGGAPGTCPDILVALDGALPAGSSSAGLILKSESSYNHGNKNDTPFRFNKQP
jgi:hypothetical protein